MRNLRRLAWSAAIALATSSPALAQTTTGGNIGSAASQAATISGTGQTTTTAGTQTTQGSSSAPGSSSIGSTTPTSNFIAAATLKPPSQSSTSNTNSSIASSNYPFRNYYGNPYYQGINLNNNQPGGFGTALYPATTNSTTSRNGQNTRAGAASTSVNTSDPGGQIVPLPRQIAYASQVMFKSPTGNTMPRLQSDLRGAIDRLPATSLANPAGVSVEVDGRTVVIRGSVRDEDESRLLEGLIRLTPGVGQIKNELAIPQ